MAAPAAVATLDALLAHAAEYGPAVKAAYLELHEAWRDLETPEEEQQAVLAAAMRDALDVWRGAVAAAARQQAELRAGIQALLAEIQDAKEALGGAPDAAAEAALERLQASRGAHATLREWEADVSAQAARWRQATQARLAEYEELQARISAVRRLCGLAVLPPAAKPELRPASLEFQQLELTRLLAEKERRGDVLRSLLSDLGDACGELGEDAKAAAAAAHPSLAALWDDASARELCGEYRQLQLAPPAGGASRDGADLSDATISALSAQLAATRELKRQRSAQVEELLAVLRSLWEATSVDPPARLVALASGPQRLHARTLDKVRAEVARLEEVREAQLVALIRAKADELRALCSESHMPEPPSLAALLHDLGAEGGAGEAREPCGAAEPLAKVVAMLAEAQVQAAKRRTLVAAVCEVEGALREEAWLAAYEADEQRYKGRNANKKLQRAIRAKKLRETLPATLDTLRGLLAEWRDTEGGRFEFDGRDYEAEVLDALAAEVEEAAAQRATKARALAARRQSVGGAAPLASPARASAAGSAASGQGGAPPRAGSASSPPVRRADGPATPIVLRSLSGRSLADRHSICVPMRGGREVGPAALSRSGEVRLKAPVPRTASSASSSKDKASPAPAPRSLDQGGAGRVVGRDV
ncbi:MAP65-4 [Scenedesmus sp. PABB004]|nr:MAP65-4 [Scenedesmus sp. PABB004]